MCSFQPGDVAELRPENPPELISTFIDLMQWSDSDMPLQVQTADQGGLHSYVLFLHN